MSDHKSNKGSGRIGAFTVAELVVVALLSVLTVSIGFSALDLISQQLSNYDQDSAQAMVYSDLSRVLHRDFLFCQQAERRAGQTVALTFDSLTISYTARADYILRFPSLPGAPTDTFFLRVDDFSTTFEQQPVQVGWVDRLEIRTTVNEQEHILSFGKEYGAADFYRRQGERR